ncbi:hypothetical protein BaRGS_00008988 [Batillaria attramentaria]|uniref:Uncharacterized protein n=1 Tax=Batillaria attramentaria TaxID=370345 RepID=A0ABD0LKZ7_9CAEN
MSQTQITHPLDTTPSEDMRFCPSHLHSLTAVAFTSLGTQNSELQMRVNGHLANPGKVRLKFTHVGIGATFFSYG